MTKEVKNQGSGEPLNPPLTAENSAINTDRHDGGNDNPKADSFWEATMSTINKSVSSTTFTYDGKTLIVNRAFTLFDGNDGEIEIKTTAPLNDAIKMLNYLCKPEGMETVIKRHCRKHGFELKIAADTVLLQKQRDKEKNTKPAQP